ncbi:hypothetical protein EV426DRAFT_586627 [Tirmania nivea]|nr:hypothetical protein EV426DRAFT_586627 [Tirmania nivea]
MSEDNPIALDDFPIDAYFDKRKPATWQLGAFSNYCYQLPGFPSTDRKKRKRTAFNLWQQALEHISETNDAEKRNTALKLMKGFKKQSIKINNHITVTGGTNATVNNVVGNFTQVTGSAGCGAKLGENQSSLDIESSGSPSLPPPPPYERAKQPTYERKRKGPPRERDLSSSASTAPPPKRSRHTAAYPPPLPRIATPPLPSQQPIRQQLLHLRETSLREIAAANASIRPQLQQSLQLLDGLRQFTLTQLAFIEQAMGEVERLSKRCADLAEEVDKKVEGLIEDPVLVGDDYMLTEREETEPEGEGVEEESGGFGSSPPPAPPLDEGFRFGSSPPPLVWLAHQEYAGIEDFF